MLQLFKRRAAKDPLIDFTQKRLGLTHNPRVLTTNSEASFNERAEAITNLRKEFGIDRMQAWKH